MPTEAQREANKRYRAKNYARVKQINAKSNRKMYKQDVPRHLARAKEHYQNNRNYKGDISNMGKVLTALFAV